VVASAIHDAMTAYLITRTTVEAERYFLNGLLQARGPRDLAVAEALAGVDSGRAGLLFHHDSGARWEIFIPDVRVTSHAHHGRKYADTCLPEPKAFRFLHTDGTPAVAHSVTEFCTAVQTVPLASLRHHLLSGDFSHWAIDTLGDAELAARLRKLEDTTRLGVEPSRDEILTHIREIYLA
jgi:hypothetical protein